MNSEDDYFDFEFSQENEESTTNSITSVLDDVFGATQKQTEINIKKINLNKKCKLNTILNLEYNYKKFVYPSHEDILKEMNDTKNPKINCWKSHKNVENDTYSFELDSNILREFDNPMTSPDINSEIADLNQSNKINENFNEVFNKDLNFTYSNNKSEKNPNKNMNSTGNLIGKPHFEVDLDLESIPSQGNEINPEIINVNNLTDDFLIENIPRLDFEIQSKNIVFGGFKTATGRNIPKSEIGEMKAKQIFASIEENLQAEIDKQQISLLETSENKIDNIEKENNRNSLFRKQIYRNSENSDKLKPILLKENMPKLECKSTICEGFKTATGHSIRKSESADRKARKLFESIEEEITRDELIIDEETPENISLESQYRTDRFPYNSLSNKYQKIELGKLGKSRKITFESIEEEENNIDEHSLIRSESELIMEKNTFFTGKTTEIDRNSQKFCTGFKTGTGRVIPLSESAGIKARKLFDSISEEEEEDINENISGLVHCSLNSNTNLSKSTSSSNENLEENTITLNREQLKTTKNPLKNICQKENNIKSITEGEREGEANLIKIPANYEGKDSIQNRNSPDLITNNDINEDNSLEAGKERVNEAITTTGKEMENCDCSWDYFDFTESEETKSSINPSPVVNNSNRTLSNEKFHVLSSSTPIKKAKNRVFTDITNSLNDSLSGRTGASMILQENIASKNVTLISAKLGRFSQFRLDKCNMFSLRKLCRLSSSSKQNENVTFDNNNNNCHNIDFNTCVDMKFYCDKSILSLMVGDNGLIVPDNDGYIGLSQFIDSFMGLPNVDPKLISNEWITNHYRMILWKLLAMDNQYREYLADNWLSPHHIMLQLKYRYDKEIDHAKRPALRKICEHDDSASKRLILIVVSIEKVGNDSFKVLVSDGWYFVPAIFDKVLKDQIIKKKIKPGTKLITCNAMWIGYDGPITLPTNAFPLNCGLKMHGNSTRRARSFAKLGYQYEMGPFPLTLSSLNPNGGITSLINVIINRVYPIQYMETIYHPNQENPQRIFRTERAEEFARKQFDQTKEKIINSTLEKMLTPNSTNNKRQKMNKVANLNSGEEIMNWLNNSIDQDSAQIELSSDQQNILISYKENVVTEVLQTKCPNRNVVTLLRILVVGCFAGDVDSKQVAIMTLWKPSDELMALLVEGASVKIYSVAVNHAKLDISFSVTGSTIALNSTSSTRFERNSEIHENLVAKLYQCRQSFSIVNACQFLSNATSACEIDCVGIVIALSKVTTTSNDSWQHVVLSDPNNMDDGIILLKLWGGLQSNFLTNVIEMGNSVKFLNLQYRKSLYSRLAPHSQTLIFECHYGTHSNAVYVSRKWNFFTIKQSLHDQLEKYLPSFEILTQDKNISKIFSSKIPVSSPLASKENTIRSSPNNKSLLKSNDSPKMITSTPKRLGLSGKRVLRTSVTELGSKSTEVLNTARIDKTVENNVPINSISTDYDGFDMNSSIAEFVKLRRRTFNLNNRSKNN